MAHEIGADMLKITRQSDGLEADLLPLQGLWTEAQYLRLTDQTNHLIEFTDGVIEVLPMPTDSHQVILLVLYDLLKTWVVQLGDKVLVAPLRVQVKKSTPTTVRLLHVRSCAYPLRERLTRAVRQAR